MLPSPRVAVTDDGAAGADGGFGAGGGLMPEVGVADTYQGAKFGAGSLTAPAFTARRLKRYSVPFFSL